MSAVLKDRSCSAGSLAFSVYSASCSAALRSSLYSYIFTFTSVNRPPSLQDLKASTKSNRMEHFNVIQPVYVS